MSAALCACNEHHQPLVLLRPSHGQTCMCAYLHMVCIIDTSCCYSRLLVEPVCVHARCMHVVCIMDCMGCCSRLLVKPVCVHATHIVCIIDCVQTWQRLCGHSCLVRSPTQCGCAPAFECTPELLGFDLLSPAHSCTDIEYVWPKFRLCPLNWCTLDFLQNLITC